ncbi:thiamine phosphate synthase [Nevskia ramosa]|uniref:thiamine phosphate synthase n=1 Tax=Nevskia ramosa TaxID=64002 RepID=UPI0003B3C961|nr:thiamine phosphate synthase [Nevskia ramosa]
MNGSPRGLYAVTPDALADNPSRLLAACAAALVGGAVLLQYRDKRSAPARREQNAIALLALCRAHGGRLIINDDAALAARIGADGAHLGASDGSLSEARARLGPQALIGASCGDSLARAETAIVAGASYVAFGRYFASNTKPDAPPASLATLTAARSRLVVPLCAIGGITPDNGALLITAGADWLAAVDGLFGDGEPAGIESRARAYCALFVAS